MRTFSAPILLFSFLVVLCSQPSLASGQDWLYTVQEGDSLWTIGKQNLKSMRYWRKLVDLNGLKEPFYLRPGTTIRIPFEWVKEGASAAKVVAVSGQAVVIRNNSATETPAVVNMFLWHNDRIRTATQAGATLQFSDGSEVLLQEDTEVVVGKLMRYGAGGMTETNLRLESGRIHQKVVPASGPGSRFEIKSPSAVAAVRGTEYRMSANGDGSSQTEVLGGAVRLESFGETEGLDRGYGAVTFSDKKPLPPTKLLPSPDLALLPREIATVPFLLDIPAIPGARSYRIQIAMEKNFTSLLFDKTFPGTNLWGPDIPNGFYFLRINGIDENGLEGLYAIHRFKMVAHPVPPIPLSPRVDAVVANCQPTFLWSQREKTKSYSFQLADNDQFTSVQTEAADDPQYRLQKKLAPGVYYWRLASVDHTGHMGPYGEPQSFRCPPPQPDMSSAKLNKKEMVYRWPDVKVAVRYRFQISQNDDFIRTLVDEELVESQFNLGKLAPGTYYIRVATITSDGFIGPYSLPQMVVVDAPPPNPLVVAGSVLLMIAILLL